MSLSKITESKPVPFQHVSITSIFWNGRMNAIREGSLPAIYQQMKETGRWDCLKLKWKPGDAKKPHQFWDSDIAKWLEAACYSLIRHPEPTLARLVEEAVDNIRGAQQDDGYINTYYTVVEPELKWANIAWSHELYCAGHLLEAAVAHYIYSGSYRLLGPLLKYMEYIGTVFGPEEGKKRGYPGHEEIELSLVKAYETTENSGLLTQARYFIEERGQHRPQGHYYDIEAKARGVPPRPGPGFGAPYSYHQADRPIREIRSVEGHSVRAMYWLAGATGVARLTGDRTLFKAVEHLWKSTTHRKMYVTGGLGAMPDWEGFGPDYYLPNESGYLETCAAVALVFFAHQMTQIDTFNAEYANAMELALYNAVLVGVSLDGKSFFYDNPLASIDKHLIRKSWFDVSCCPANVSRLVSSVGGYIYSIRADSTIVVHLYISSTTSVTLPTGEKGLIHQDSGGPWYGKATFIVKGLSDSRVSLCLRKPPGTESFTVTTGNGGDYSMREDTVDYVLVTYSGQEDLTVDFSFKARRIYPHALNLDNRNCVAIARGPLIYCAESVDNTEIEDLRSIRLSDDAEFEEIELDNEGLSRYGFTSESKLGLPVILLRTNVRIAAQRGEGKKSLTLIPYFMWANRGRSDLRVWLPRT